MSTAPWPMPRPASFRDALGVQMRVIGALILRELHTRYGRDNIGYLWMIGEPLMLATVIGILHAATGHTAYGGDIKPVAFGVLGYVTFILFRGIVNRAEGGVEANAPLLYHKQVTVLDIVISRALLEFCAVFMTLIVIMSFLVKTGFADPPARPLLLVAGWILFLWYSFGQALIISAISYESRTVGRLVHPYSYFMTGLSGAFFQMAWLPHPFRDILEWLPMTSCFELVRYGWFESTNLDYFFGQYLIGSCLVLTWIGLVLVRRMRSHIHLS